jgi:succinate dehydrogenase / fumarate reductase membrane anchor subunit
MKWEDHQFNPALGRARGLGAAGAGATHHWIHQRITAVANIFLTVWFILWTLSVLSAIGSVSRETLSENISIHDMVKTSLSMGLNPIFMILFIVSIFYHAKLGLQMVIEDYVACEATKITSLLALKFIILFLTTICLFSVLKVTL